MKVHGHWSGVRKRRGNWRKGGILAPQPALTTSYGTDPIQEATVDQPAPTIISDPNNETTIVLVSGKKLARTVKTTDGHVYYDLPGVPTLKNVEVRVEFDTSSNTGWQYGLALRRTATGSLLFRTNGTAVELVEDVNGVFSAPLASFALNFQPNTRFYLQHYALGNQFKCVAWAKGAAIPATWQIEVTINSRDLAGAASAYAHKAGTKNLHSYSWRKTDADVQLPSNENDRLTYTLPFKLSAVPLVAGWYDLEAAPAGDASEFRPKQSYPGAVHLNGVVGQSLVHEGRIYCLGGDPDTGLRQMNIYDTTRNEWFLGPALPGNRRHTHGGFINNKLYMVGGFDAGIGEPGVWEYDPATLTFTTKAATGKYQGARLSMGVVHDGKLYFFGGEYNGAKANAMLYNPVTDTFTALTSMPTANYGMVSVVLGSQIYVFGGVSVNQGLRFDPAAATGAGSWTQIAAPPAQRAYAAAGVIDGKIIMAGGLVGTAEQRSVYSYDPATNTWTTLADAPFTLAQGFSSVVDGVLYHLLGTRNAAGVRRAVAYVPTRRPPPTFLPIEPASFNFEADPVGAVKPPVVGFYGGNASANLSVLQDAILASKSYQIAMSSSGIFSTILKDVLMKDGTYRCSIVYANGTHVQHEVSLRVARNDHIRFRVVHATQSLEIVSTLNGAAEPTNSVAASIAIDTRYEVIITLMGEDVTFRLETAAGALVAQLVVKTPVLGIGGVLLSGHAGSGNVRFDNVVVTPVIVPQLTITAGGGYEKPSPHTISGTVDILPASLSYTLNGGVRVPLTPAKTFSFNIALATGENTVVIYAGNTQGQETYKSVLVSTQPIAARSIATGTNNFLTVPDSVSVRSAVAAFTLEAWVKKSGTATGAGIISEIFTGAGNVMYELGLGIGTPNGSEIPEAGFYNGTWRMVTHNAVLANNVWAHLAVTWDGTTLRLYINGVLVATNVPASANVADTNGLVIGRRHDTPGAPYVPFWPGLIYQPRIWNTARTVEQINASMNKPIGEPQTGLVASWPFDGFVSNIARDISGNKNQATRQGSAVTSFRTPFNDANLSQLITSITFNGSAFNSGDQWGWEFKANKQIKAIGFRFQDFSGGNVTLRLWRVSDQTLLKTMSLDVLANAWNEVLFDALATLDLNANYIVTARNTAAVARSLKTAPITGTVLTTDVTYVASRTATGGSDGFPNFQNNTTDLWGVVDLITDIS